MYSRLKITHMSFADDLLFARGDLSSMNMLHNKFKIFTATSGLQANLSENAIYLGVPLSTNKLSIVQWKPLIDEIVAKISSWTTKKLSYAGRIQLVRSVIFGVQAYWAQIIVVPAKVMKAI